MSPPPARAASVASSAPTQQPEATPNAAKATEDDIFNQLARIASLEAQLNDVLAERGELEARIKRFQVDWLDCNRHLQEAESSAAAARAGFTNIIAARGGIIHDVTRNGTCVCPPRVRTRR